MKRSWVLLISFSAIFFSCNNSDSKNDHTEDNYKLTKESLLKQEQKNPQKFLVVGGHDKRNLFGQTVIKATVTNKATVAVFKDVDVKLTFYSKTGVLLETDKETVFEVLQPGESKNFRTKYFAPKGTDSVALEVLGAKISPE